MGTCGVPHIAITMGRYRDPYIAILIDTYLPYLLMLMGTYGGPYIAILMSSYRETYLAFLMGMYQRP
jgi:hypothetical protein